MAAALEGSIAHRSIVVDVWVPLSAAAAGLVIDVTVVGAPAIKEHLSEVCAEVIAAS